jgi:hypothetical protein
MDLFISQDYAVEVKLFWRKFSIGKRLFSYYQSNLIPDHIIETLEHLKSLETINLKRLYTSKTEKYGPEGLSEDSYTFNHPSNALSVNMSSHWTDETLFKSEEEQLFLKLHKALEVWKDNLYQAILKMHE